MKSDRTDFDLYSSPSGRIEQFIKKTFTLNGVRSICHLSANAEEVNMKKVIMFLVRSYGEALASLSYIR